jgi:hypothetical protein
MIPPPYRGAKVLRPASQPQIDSWAEAFYDSSGFRCSPVFLRFCGEHNGGLTSWDLRFLPQPSHKIYYAYVNNREFNRGKAIQVARLYGIGESPAEYTIEKATENAQSVWGLSSDFFVVTSDPYGFRIVSRLIENDDAVYFWEPAVEPHFFKIADNLNDFYEGLVIVPDDES